MAQKARSAAGKTAADKPDSEVEQLRRQLDESRAENARLAAERDTANTGRVQAEQRGLSEAEKRLQADSESIDSTIALLDSEADSLEAQIATLSDEPGHGKEVAALNRKLAANAARRLDQDNRKSFVEGQMAKAKADRENAGKQPAGRVLADGRPLAGFHPSVQAWFNAHPESFTDQAFLRKAVAAAVGATDLKGYREFSPEYFSHVERELGLTRDRDDRDEDLDDELDRGEDLGTEIADSRRDRATASSPYSQTDRAAPRNAKGELVDDVKNPQSRAAGPGSIATPVSRQVRQPGERRPSRAPDLTPEEREVADNLHPELPAADRYTHYAENRALMQARFPGRFN